MMYCFSTCRGRCRRRFETIVAKAARPPAPRSQTIAADTSIEACPDRDRGGFGVAAGITGYLVWPSARQRIKAQAVQDYKQSLSGNPVRGDRVVRSTGSIAVARRD